LSKISLTGNASGTGTFTLASPNSNTDRTLNLPDAAGTIQVSGNPISGTTGTFTGLVDISAAGAGQIQFPATQNASANANTLDDYEEGTWTPTVTGGGTAGTYTLSNIWAYYTKIGNQVTVTASFGFSAASGGTSYISIGGLPFNYRSQSSFAGSASAEYLNTSASSNGMTVIPVSSGSDPRILPALTTNNGAFVFPSVTGVSTSTTLRFTVTYFV
jgi:hypothetical protein